MQEKQPLRSRHWYADLRRRAEELAKLSTAGDSEGMPTDARRLIHDLHVSHIELEMQNEELRCAYRELQAIRDKYSDLYDFAPVAYLTVDDRGFVTELNLAGTTLLGLDKTNVIGKLLVTFVIDADRDTFRQLQNAIRYSTQTRTCEVWFVRSQGGVVRVRIEAVALRKETGEFTGSRMVLHDVSERKRFEEALFQEKERAQITLRSIGDAVITTTEKGIVDFINTVGENLTGWSLKEATGQPLDVVFQLIDEHTGKPLEDPVRRCLRQGQIVGLSNHSLLVNRAGREFAIQDSAAPIRDRGGNVVGAVLVFQDVTEARSLARQVAHQANHDPLTGLVNRREFEKRLERALTGARMQGSIHSLCYVDLDGFKLINDSAGHTAGDELLKQIASVLSRLGRSRDTLARIGGDEFCLLMENCPLEQAIKIAEAMVSTVRNHRFVWDGRIFNVGASVGITAIDRTSEGVAQILGDADLACYTAKDLGRNRYHIYHKFDSDADARVTPLIQIRDLQSALDANRFCLHCQPIHAVRTKDPPFDMYEVLLRLIDERGELVPPSAFIPMAERYGVMPAVDRWVIGETFQRAMHSNFSRSRPTLTVNLSGHTINDETLLAFIGAKLFETGFPPDCLCLEITETAAIHNFSQASELIDALRQRGCRFALDDFGKGVSSMAYLKHLSVDYLKIDGSFVLNMENNKIDHAMVSAMNELAHALGIETIAECVESLKVVERLTNLGVDYIQGFAIGEPVPFESLSLN